VTGPPHREREKKERNSLYAPTKKKFSPNEKGFSPGQPKEKKEISWYHKGHDISIITRAFFNFQREVPSGYIAVC